MWCDKRHIICTAGVTRREEKENTVGKHLKT